MDKKFVKRFIFSAKTIRTFLSYRIARIFWTVTATSKRWQFYFTAVYNIAKSVPKWFHCPLFYPKQLTFFLIN